MIYFFNAKRRDDHSPGERLEKCGVRLPMTRQTDAPILGKFMDMVEKARIDELAKSVVCGKPLGKPTRRTDE